jgi:inositol transport system substrate-binding protein
MEERMKRFFCLILCVVFLTMGVLSSSAAPQKKVAFICKAYSDAFCVWVKDEMVRLAKDKYANDFVFQAFDAENNSNKQIDQINNCVAAKFDVIMFQQVDVQSAVGAVKDAVSKGVVVISITGHIEDGGASTYIDSSPEAQGKMLGDFAVKTLPKNAKVAILQGPAGNPHANGREAGFKKALAARKDIKIIDEQIGEWAKEKGLTITQNWLSSIKDLKGILAHNDNMALGAYEAIKMAGKEGQIQIYGIDGMAEAVLAVKDGKMMATVFQNAIAYAEKGLDYASKAVKGQKINNMMLDSDLIVKDNVDKYIELHKKLGNIK